MVAGRRGARVLKFLKKELHSADFVVCSSVTPKLPRCTCRSTVACFTYLAPSFHLLGGAPRKGSLRSRHAMADASSPPPKADESAEIASLKALFAASPGDTSAGIAPSAASIALPPGLFERQAGAFTSCFVLLHDGGFKLRWSDSSTGTWLQGSGQAAQIVETIEGRTFKYEIKLRCDFACAVPAGSDPGAAELPNGFSEGAAKVAKKTPAKRSSPTKNGGGKGKAKKQHSARPKKAAGGSPPPGGGEPLPPKLLVMELRDTSYVIHESIACPSDAGASETEMRAWIAMVAGNELQSDFGRERVEELSTSGFPFSYSVDEPETGGID